MPRPITLKLLLRILGQNGFVLVSQKGSHAKYRRYGDFTKTVIVKVGKKEVPYGTFQSILFQSGLKESDFWDE